MIYECAKMRLVTGRSRYLTCWHAFPHIDLVVGTYVTVFYRSVLKPEDSCGPVAAISRRTKIEDWRTQSVQFDVLLSSFLDIKWCLQGSIVILFYLQCIWLIYVVMLSIQNCICMRTKPFCIFCFCLGVWLSNCIYKYIYIYKIYKYIQTLKDWQKLFDYYALGFKGIQIFENLVYPHIHLKTNLTVEQIHLDIQRLWLQHQYITEKRKGVVVFTT